MDLSYDPSPSRSPFPVSPVFSLLDLSDVCSDHGGIVHRLFFRALISDFRRGFSPHPHPPTPSVVSVLSGFCSWNSPITLVSVFRAAE